MQSAPTTHITGLLAAWGNGNRAALDEMMPLIEEELRRLAHRYISRERPGHTLQTTALVNEAYVRLVDQKKVKWQNRAHFFAIAAKTMRRILVDYARKNKCAKRGGGAVQVSLSEADALANDPSAEVAALDEALTRLESLDPLQARVVELRFFGGLTIKETAEAMAVSVDLVKRDWSTARAWLYSEMTKI